MYECLYELNKVFKRFLIFSKFDFESKLLTFNIRKSNVPKAEKMQTKCEEILYSNKKHIYNNNLYNIHFKDNQLRKLILQNQQATQQAYLIIKLCFYCFDLMQ